MPHHPAIEAGGTAVITGGAGGIGLAAGKRFASLGLRVVLADLAGEKLTAALAEVAARSARWRGLCSGRTDRRLAHRRGPRAPRGGHGGLR